VGGRKVSRVGFRPEGRDSPPGSLLRVNMGLLPLLPLVPTDGSGELGERVPAPVHLLDQLFV
jgi:hypothetical protein